MKVTFQGGSDDLVEINGFGATYGDDFPLDEFGVKPPFSCELHAADGSAAVLVRLDLIGEGWIASLGRIDEGVPILPDLGIELTDGDRDYNVLLALIVDPSTQLRHLRDADGELADADG